MDASQSFTGFTVTTHDLGVALVTFDEPERSTWE